MEKELPVIEVQSSRKPDWYGGAFCTAFVYSKHKGNFLVKGFTLEVKDYIKKNFTHYFVNYTYWGNGEFRSVWNFWRDRYYIYEPDRKRTYGRTPNYKWRINHYNEGTTTVLFEFRRMPNRWIPEFDNLK